MQKLDYRTIEGSISLYLLVKIVAHPSLQGKRLTHLKPPTNTSLGLHGTFAYIYMLFSYRPHSMSCGSGETRRMQHTRFLLECVSSVQFSLSYQSQAISICQM